MRRLHDILETVALYDPHYNEKILSQAYVTSMQAHSEQRRANGDPYFSHPVEVAGLLVDMKFDTETIAAALLHDVLEDTNISEETLTSVFGEDIVFLIKGVTKLSKTQKQISPEERNSENLRKFMMALSQDIRVLVIKLADRLHNIRTLHYIKSEEKRKKIAKETLNIYAPLAERLGIDTWKTELEDTSFQIVYPEIRQKIIQKLQKYQKPPLEETCSLLETLLKENGHSVTVTGRIKTPYSLWKKMEKNHLGFDDIADIKAFRIFTETPQDCYTILGCLHQTFQSVPGRFKDYISTPKQNGYQSLHTTVITKNSQKIEIQIRTHSMHDVAERGIAAHWNYKTSKDSGKILLSEIIDPILISEKPLDLVDNGKIDLYKDKVFVLTQNNSLLMLPKGSSGLDFAYAIHNDIGNTCHSIEKNGNFFSPEILLENGDHVVVHTDPNIHPIPQWEEWVITAKAKTNIKKYLTDQQKQDFIDLGKTILKETLHQNEKPYDITALPYILKSFSYKKEEDLFYDIGKNRISVDSIVKKFPHKKFSLQRILSQFNRKKEKPPKKMSISSSSLGIHPSSCCHPIPGDKIIGLHTKDIGILIHRHDCPDLKKMSYRPDQWIDLEWTDKNITIQTRTYSVILKNTPGSLGIFCTKLGTLGGNIIYLKFIKRSVNEFELLITVSFTDPTGPKFISLLKEDPVKYINEKTILSES